MENNDYRDEWRDARFKRYGGADPAAVVGRRRTALQKLARRYLRFSNLALVFIMLLPINLISVSREPGMMWVAGGFGVIMLVASVMDRWLYHGVSSIDCANMPVAEVSRLTLYYRRRHLQFVAILLPMALAAIGGMVYCMAGDTYFIMGVTVGFCVGLAIGIRQLLAFMADYREASR